MRRGYHHRSRRRDREDEGISWDEEAKQEEGLIDSTDAFGVGTATGFGLIVSNANASTIEVTDASERQAAHKLQKTNAQGRKESQAQSTTRACQGKGRDSASTSRLSDHGKPVQVTSKMGKQRSKIDKDHKLASWRTILGGNSVAIGDQEESFYGIFDRDDEDAENGGKI